MDRGARQLWGCKVSDTTERARISYSCPDFGGPMSWASGHVSWGDPETPGEA